MKTTILILALLSTSAHGLDLSLPQDEIIHPWSLEKPERVNTIRLNGEEYTTIPTAESNHKSFVIGPNGFGSYNSGSIIKSALKTLIEARKL